MKLVYIILAKIIDKSTFLNRNLQEGVNLYQDYMDTINHQSNTSNLFTTTLRNFGTSIVSID